MAKKSLPRRERAVLVVDREKGKAGEDMELQELTDLARSAGAEVVGVITKREGKPSPAFFIGTGKVEELKELLAAVRSELVIFSAELNPVQLRNLEDELETKVVDKTGLILDIFALRAQTKEAKLQVEKAQLEYILPRLTGEGVALSRLAGGIGTRGPGESKLESDRRRVRRRISNLNRRLKEVKANRDQQRQPRERKDWPTLALVGYTNAGKSTLFRTLSGAEVEVEDSLFCTLDPTLRQITLPDHQKAFLIDTVGFIRGLPHQLVAAFRATLEETVQADLLLHVVNLESPWVEEEYAAVLEVLRTLQTHEKPMITVLNKKDRMDNEFTVARLMRNLPTPVAISALTGDGVDNLLDKIASILSMRIARGRFFLPYTEGHLLTVFHEKGRVLNEEYQSDGIMLHAELSRVWYERLREFKVEVPWEAPEGENPG